MRIAIVGAGISGLAAAHLVAREHEITVFEADWRPGGHANTVRVDTEHATHHVDTGFIVFNDRNYPNFQRLLASLRVPSQPSDMSFGDIAATLASRRGLPSGAPAATTVLAGASAAITAALLAALKET